MAALTYKEIHKRINECRDGSYTLITKENELDKWFARAKVTIGHTCGNSFISSLQSFVNDGYRKCDICFPNKITGGKLTTLTLDVFKEKLKEIRNNEVVYVKGFKTGNKNTCTVKHTICNTEFQARPNDLLNPKRADGCEVCRKNKISESNRNDISFLDDIIVEGYTWLSKNYITNKDLLPIRHEECKLEYFVRPNDFQQGYRCPDCANGLKRNSRNAVRIETHLKKKNISFKTEFIDINCKSDKNGQLRFDFAIPLKDKILLLEYDGEFHFNDANFSKLSQSINKNTIRRDKIKNQFVKDNSTKYVLRRISYKDPIIKTLNHILKEFKL